MNYLKKKRCYLSGPIEHDKPDSTWRDVPRKVLVEEFGLKLFDPIADPKQQWVPKLEAAREAEDYKTMRKIGKKFVAKDLGLVDRADLVIACVPRKVPTTGTVHEIINSHNAKKPTMLVCEQGKKHIPAWYFGFVKHKYMFGSWEDCFAYLREVNEGKHKKDRRWSFVYGLI